MATDSEKAASQRLNEVDFHLADIIHLANTGDIEFPITLTVGGMLVTGLLTGGKRYFNEFGENMTKAMGSVSDETKERVREFFGGPAVIYDEPPDEDGGPRRPVGYIHLREARFFIPGAKPIPEAGGVLWRGRLEQVDGFHIGMLVLG